MAKRLPMSRKTLRTLSLDRLVELDTYVRQLIRESKKAVRKKADGHRPASKREVIKEKVRDNKTYRLVLVRCGKENCKCAKGSVGHGPYWYAFWSEKGTTKCKYVGKKLPMKLKGDRTGEF